MSPVLIVVAPSLPYGYLWEILFAAILAVSLGLAVMFPSFGKKWVLILFVVGVAEMEFSFNTHGYNILVVGLIIGLITAYSGFIIPALYLAKLHLRKKKTRIIFILSGCLELVLGALGVLYSINFGVDPFLLYFGLLTIGFYSSIVGMASLYFPKPSSVEPAQ
jgi:hypothetical protein